MRVLLFILILSSILLSMNHPIQPQLSVSNVNSSSPYIQEFQLPTPQAIPGPIAVALDGTVWFAETNGSSLAKFDPSTKTFTEFAFKNSQTFILPRYAAESTNSIATDSQGNVWFTLSAANAFGYFNTTTEAFTYYNLTRLTNRTYDYPYGITLDPYHNVWVAERGASRIGKLDLSNGSFREYILLQSNASPLEMYIDKNYDLWITSYWYNNTGYGTSGSTLTKFDPSKWSIIHDYNLSAARITAPVGVVVDQSGIAWVGDHAGAWLGEVNTATGEIKLHRTSLPPLNPNPASLTDRVFQGATITLVNDVVLGNDGTPWFTEHFGGRLGHYIPANDTTAEYNIPTFTPYTLWLAADRTGGIWFTEENGNKLGYLNTLNAIPPFEVTSPQSISPQISTCGSTLTISIKNLSPNSINITAGVENTPSFSGSINSLSLPGGASAQVPVQIIPSPYLPAGNYISAASADIIPVIKVTDPYVNYPITVFADVTSATICPGALLYAIAGSILAFAGITGALFLFKRKKNSTTRVDSLSQT